MKVLMLTWEFPPYISGGLGMACYGISRALLELDVDIDMLLPTKEEVFFPMDKPDDVDHLRVEAIREKTILGVDINKIELKERLKRIGMSETPESYVSMTFDYEKFISKLSDVHIQTFLRQLNVWKEHAGAYSNIFQRVQQFTATAVRYAGNYNCDVIHSHDWLTYPAGIALKHILKKPLVAHIHATEFDRAGGTGDGRIHHIEYRGLAEADIVVAVSNYTAKIIVDRYRVDPAKIRVVHNAFTLQSINEKRYKLFKDPMVLFLGRVTLQKGPDYFLEIANRVISRHPNVRFVMAGSGDMFPYILKASASRKLKDRFLFAGFLNRGQVEKILPATDIFIMPSVSEPFGIAPLEAMANGAVAIISKQSGVAEVVKNAFKVDFWDVEKTADIIVDLLDNPEKISEIAKAGSEEVELIKWKEAAQKLHRIYGEL